MQRYDIVFVGHTYRDEIHHPGRPPVRTVGGALNYGALAAARVGCRVAVVTRMAERDRGLLADLEAAGVDVMLRPAPVTSQFEVVYPAEGAEHRVIRQVCSAGPFAADEVPPLEARCVHLAGNAQGEFPLAFVAALRRRAARLALDMQAFVRQPGPDGHELQHLDVPDKRELAGLVDALKLDALETRILTGCRDPLAGLAEIASWGCPEIVMTREDGVALRHGGATLFAPFSNRGAAGRNGRGDTTFAAYLARRLDHPPEAALEFAAALVSIKLERPGAFAGSAADVAARMNEARNKPRPANV